MPKTIALFSGGLDSILAVKLVQEQKIEVIALHFVTPFNSSSEGRNHIENIAATLGAKLEFLWVEEEYLPIVKNPEHGYGKNLNPCLDCHIYMCRKAKKYMDEAGGDFIITGEVLGQRPMSQRRDTLRVVERDSGLDGLLLRPLSAKHLKPTFPEDQGLVAREKLLDLHGRSRKPQIKMAEEYGLKNYPTPAGGCLLTDPGFSRRLKDLMEHDPCFTLNDVELLKWGRHFRFSPETKTVVGRNEKENKSLLTLSRKGDFVFSVQDFPGPITLLRGNVDEKVMNFSASITVRYSKAKDKKEIAVVCRKLPGKEKKIFLASPLEEELKKESENLFRLEQEN